MTKKEKAKQYFKDLSKMIKKCPKGYRLVYDSGKAELFMVNLSGEFVDTDSGSGSTMCITVGGNYTPTKLESDGHMLIVDDGIDTVSLEAVSNKAIIE